MHKIRDQYMKDIRKKKRKQELKALRQKAIGYEIDPMGPDDGESDYEDELLDFLDSIRPKFREQLKNHDPELAGTVKEIRENLENNSWDVRDEFSKALILNDLLELINQNIHEMPDLISDLFRIFGAIAEDKSNSEKLVELGFESILEEYLSKPVEGFEVNLLFMLANLLAHFSVRDHLNHTKFIPKLVNCLFSMDTTPDKFSIFPSNNLSGSRIKLPSKPESAVESARLLSNLSAPNNEKAIPVDFVEATLYLEAILELYSAFREEFDVKMETIWVINYFVSSVQNRAERTTIILKNQSIFDFVLDCLEDGSDAIMKPALRCFVNLTNGHSNLLLPVISDRLVKVSAISF